MDRVLGTCADNSDSVPFSSTSNETVNSLVTQLCRLELISVDTGLSLGEGLHSEHLAPQPAHYQLDHFLTLENDTDLIRQSLSSMVTDFSQQRSLGAAVLYVSHHPAVCDATSQAHLPLLPFLSQAIQQHAQSSDLASLTYLCQTLITAPSALDVLFVYVEPHELLSPVRQLLDGYDATLESFGESHPIERYGALAVWLQVVLARHGLYEDLSCHLGAGSGFCVHWLGSVSSVYALQGLEEEGKAAVGGWIGGLFGEGISDELIKSVISLKLSFQIVLTDIAALDPSSTNPRVLLRVAPTICQQSLAACEAGVIDLDTLKEGLQYFLQDLLSFTLPGVIRWLTKEIVRTP